MHAFVAFLSFFLLLIVPIHTYAQEVLPGVLYVRFKAETPANALLSSGLSIQEMRPAFSRQQPRFKGQQATQHPLFSIQLLRYADNLSPQQAAKHLASQDNIDFAEPVWIPKPLLTPNDERFGNAGLDYFSIINAQAAWDITQGDSSVVVAIVDTGTDWQHEDLASRVWFNPGESGLDENQNPRSSNGIDDDGNGFIDDVHGWDFLGNDPDPSPGSSTHGTHVAGIAAAATNNGIGVSSLGFNLRYMPIRIGDISLPFSWEGVIYAAENGADVINMSWGSPRFSITGEEVVRFAREQGAVLIAASGNDGNQTVFYPAGYPEVIAVSAIDETENKATFSDFGTFVDIAAPGNNILSTLPGNQYGTSSGTSMAAPIVSALAGLLKSAHPEWNNAQIEANIRRSGRPLASSTFENQLLGHGIINAEAALSPALPAINIRSFAFSDTLGNGDGILSSDEDIELLLELENLGQATDLQITFAPAFQNLISPGNGSGQDIMLLAGQRRFIGRIPFNVALNAVTDQTGFIEAQIAFDGQPVQRFFLGAALNPSFGTLTANTIELSFDANGRIGFLDFPTNDKGSAFLIRQAATTTELANSPLLREGGLLIMAEETNNNISSSVRGSNPGQADDDFTIRRNFRFIEVSEQNSQGGELEFTDFKGDDSDYQLLINQRVFAFNNSAEERFLILEYQFTNRHPLRDWSRLRVGLFLNFDLPFEEASNDVIEYDSEADIIFHHEKETESQLTIASTIFDGIGSPWLINNNGSTASNFSINDGFTDFEKSIAMVQGPFIERQANVDGSFVMATPAFSLARDESKTFFFLLAYGANADSAKASIESARQRVDRLITPNENIQSLLPREFAISSAFPNPFNPSTQITIDVPSTERVSIHVFDVLGRNVATLANNRLFSGSTTLTFRADNLASGIYIVRAFGENGQRVQRKITLVK